MSYYLRKAQPGEENTVYAMVAERVKWMDDHGIHQWNETDYLDVYPVEYYRRNLDQLYVLTDEASEQITCAAILLKKDERWDSDEPSFYIHNFVSSLHCHGVGTLFIQKVQELSEEEGIEYLRLDSADDNDKLASYYKKLGFEACGVCGDGKYHGILRQKKVHI